MKLVFLSAMYLLPFHEALNIIFKDSFASAWKQIIVIIFLTWSFRNLYLNSQLSGIFAYLTLSLSLLVLSGFFLSVGVEFILLSGVIYYSFYSFVFSTKSFVVMGFDRLFLRHVPIVATIGALGLFLDYSTSIFDFIPRGSYYDSIDLFEMEELKRASFLFGVSTLVYMTQSLGFVILIYNAKYLVRFKIVWRIVFLLLAFIVISSVFVTGGRAQLLLSLILIVGVLWKLYSLRFLSIILFLSCFLVIFFSGLDFDREADVPSESYVLQQTDLLFDRIMNPIEAGDDSNSVRLNAWSDGLYNIVDGENSFFGNGFGTGYPSAPSATKSKHFENTFFQSWSEGGFLAFSIRIIPFALVFFVWFSRRLDCLTWLLCFWMFTVFVYFNSAPIGSAFHNQFYLYSVVAIIIIKSGLVGSYTLVYNED
ncbi:MAG: O-antigen ligase family protein [Limnobacter sp.]|uniref:O-antigen ligase family protein n=1 Tax=Limnobacter sp. TaxID=2003368 RepID=UPI004037BCCC